MLGTNLLKRTKVHVHNVKFVFIQAFALSFLRQESLIAIIKSNIFPRQLISWKVTPEGK